MRIVVTGGTGKGGAWVVRDLLDHGHEVRNVDVRPGGSSSGQTLVADLTDRVHRDPKTRLMNFGRFIEQLEAFLALEQRGHWSAVGLVDIASFKWYNDTLGHALGDRIIDRILRSSRFKSDIDSASRARGWERSGRRVVSC